MKPVVWILPALLSWTSSYSAEYPIPELGLKVVAPAQVEWTVNRQGNPTASGGFAFWLSRENGAKVFAVTASTTPNEPEVPVRLTPNEEREAATIGKEVGRRPAVVAGMEALELRLESRSESESKRAIVRVFQIGHLRCAVISITTGPASLEPPWPDEDEDLMSLFAGVQHLEEPKALNKKKQSTD